MKHYLTLLAFAAGFMLNAADLPNRKKYAIVDDQNRIVTELTLSDKIATTWKNRPNRRLVLRDTLPKDAPRAPRAISTNAPVTPK